MCCTFEDFIIKGLHTAGYYDKICLNLFKVFFNLTFIVVCSVHLLASFLGRLSMEGSENRIRAVNKQFHIFQKLALLKRIATILINNSLRIPVLNYIDQSSKSITSPCLNINHTNDVINNSHSLIALKLLIHFNTK